VFVICFTTKDEQDALLVDLAIQNNVHKDNFRFINRKLVLKSLSNIKGAVKFSLVGHWESFTSKCLSSRGLEDIGLDSEINNAYGVPFSTSVVGSSTNNTFYLQKE
jgi:hypothetical protein